MKNQLQRILVAAIGIPLALGLVWYGGLPLALAMGVIGALGTRELFGLGRRTGARPLQGLGVALAVIVPLVVWVVAGESPGEPISSGEGFVATVLAPFWLWIRWPMAAVLVPLVVLTAVLFLRRPEEKPLEAAALTLLAPVYCAVLPSSLLWIRYQAGGERWPATWLVFFPLAITWICDSCAMWGGQLMGGPKLWPAVSPGKTRSGGVAGVIGGTLGAVAYSALVLASVGRALPLVQAAVMGIVLSVVAQIGDLAESLVKREAGVKDASHLIPGHGGVLDRLDSLYFVLPVAAVLYEAFGVL